MTFKPRTVTVSRENKMSIKDLVGRKMSKKVNFLNEKIDIVKLTVGQVSEIQESVKEAKEDDGDLSLLISIIRMAVTDSEDLSDEDFNEFPLDEVAKLSNEIMKYSGMDNSAKN